MERAVGRGLRRRVRGVALPGASLLTRCQLWLKAFRVRAWQLIGARARDQTGQATLEYAVVLATFLALCAGLAAIWHASANGVFARASTEAASHSMNDPIGLAKDISLY